MRRASFCSMHSIRLVSNHLAAFCVLLRLLIGDAAANRDVDGASQVVGTLDSFIRGIAGKLAINAKEYNNSARIYYHESQGEIYHQHPSHSRELLEGNGSSTLKFLPVDNSTENGVLNTNSSASYNNSRQQQKQQATTIYNGTGTSILAANSTGNSSMAPPLLLLSIGNNSNTSSPDTGSHSNISTIRLPRTSTYQYAIPGLDTQNMPAHSSVSFSWDQPHKDALAAGAQKGGGAIGDTPFNVSVRVVVIVNGQLRGGPIAWESLERYLLDHFRADLALLGPPLHYYIDRNISDHRNFKETGHHAANSSLQSIVSLRRRAKYIWDVEEPDDWGDVLSNYSDYSTNKTAWRQVLCHDLFAKSDREAQFLGGVDNCHPGSAGILLAYRALASSKIKEFRLTEKYDWFIYTRADYVYLCSPPLFSFLSSPDRVFIPNGQEWAGVTDRFSVFHSSLVDNVLGVAADVVTNFTWWHDIMWRKHPCNLETVIYMYLTYRRKLAIQKFDHVGFTVRRTQEDPSRWSLGDSRSQLGEYGDLISKYPDELDMASDTCNPWTQLRYFNGKKPLHVTMQPPKEETEEEYKKRREEEAKSKHDHPARSSSSNSNRAPQQTHHRTKPPPKPPQETKKPPDSPPSQQQQQQQQQQPQQQEQHQDHKPKQEHHTVVIQQSQHEHQQHLEGTDQHHSSANQNQPSSPHSPSSHNTPIKGHPGGPHRGRLRGRL